MTTHDFRLLHGIPESTARTRLKGEGLKYAKHREVTPELEAILRGAKPAFPAKLREVREVTRKEPAQVEREPLRVKLAQDAQPAQGDAKRDGFLKSALWVTMATQMAHTGAFFWINCPIENHWFRLVWAGLFAYGVDCTALVMTMKGAGKWILYLFLAIHFIMNLTYHLQAHDSSTAGKIWGYVLLSGVIAFSNFSYTELFSKK